MKAKMTARLCQASFIAGAVLTPPALRMTKRKIDKTAHSGARGYVKLRQRVRRLGEATGRPGQYAAIAAAFAAQAAKDAATRWRGMVEEAERDMGETKTDKFGLHPPVEPVTTIEDYMGSPVETR